MDQQPQSSIKKPSKFSRLVRFIFGRCGGKSVEKTVVQSTVVPAGTSDDDITPSIFAKDDVRYVEENKPEVVLVSPPNSPVLSPINRTLKQVPAYEPSILKDQVLRKVEKSLPQRHTVTEDVESKVENSEEANSAKNLEYKTRKDADEPLMNVGYKTRKEVDEPTTDVEHKTRMDVDEPTTEERRLNAELLEIHPRELKFIFELKKLSTCSVRLFNKSNSHVAFKVKATSPKKYSVRPNIGIIKPKSTCEFTVKMQAQRVAPPDMICKDMFLVQSTVVPAGTSDDDITRSIFAKDDVRYVEENKLKVVLVSPPNSLVLSPINRTLKQVPAYEPSILKDQVLRKVESLTQRHTTLLMSKRVVRKVLAGFFFLFVCMVALVSVMLGYLLNR